MAIRDLEVRNVTPLPPGEGPGGEGDASCEPDVEVAKVL
jgi:hypothetical protein